MKIRKARLEDLDRIVEIELENFSLEEAITRSVFEAHLRVIQTSFLVAEKEGKIIGYIEGPVGPHRHLQDQSFTEEIEDHSHEPGGYISVTCLSIAKEAQRLGLGQKLLTKDQRPFFFSLCGLYSGAGAMKIETPVHSCANCSLESLVILTAGSGSAI